MTGAWDGVPLNPERDGWHWVVRKGAPYPGVSCFPAFWSAAERHFQGLPNATARLDYLGPCLTPAEHQAALDATWQAACEAMREKAEHWAAVARQACNTQARVWAAKCETPDEEGEPCGECKTCAHARDAGVQAICYDNISLAIRNLPTPERPR